MKALTKLTLVAATLALCAATTQALAGDIVASPKVLDLQKSLAKVGSSGGDMIDRTIRPVSPKVLDLQRSLAKVGSTNGDMINRTVQTVSPKVRQTFELAPLK